MYSKFGSKDKLSIVTLVILVIGILSSFLNFGIISVLFSVAMPVIFIVNCLLAVYGIFKKIYFNLIGILLFLIFYNFFFQIHTNDTSNILESVSILTFNAREFKQPISNHSDKNASEEIITFIDSLQPDIITFQEASYKDGVKLTDYPYVFLGYREGVEKSLLAIYSKYPILNKGFIDFPDTMNNAIYADIKIKNDTVRIYNSHLQSFVINSYIIADKYNDANYLKHLNNTPSKQLAQAKQIKNHAAKSGKKVIICGDFNATPYSQTYRILKRDMQDSYVSKGNGFGKTFSLFHYPIRLDYILTDETIDIIRHDNFNIKLSDHEPVFIKFKIK